MTIDEKGRASSWLDDYLAELRKYPHRYADDIEGLERVVALIQSQAAEIERLTRERDDAIAANYRQAGCIHQCAAHLGPDASGTIDGLPLAVKALVTRAEATQSALSEALEVVRPFAEDAAMCAVNSDFAAARAFLSKYGREGK